MKTSAMFFLVSAWLCSASFASPIHPITDGSALFGACQSGKWVDDKTTARRIRGGERYTFYGFTARLGIGIGAKPGPSTDAQCQGEIDPDIFHVPAGAIIGIAAPWNALPRKPRALSVDPPLYRKIVGDYMAANGIHDPDVRVTQVVRCDIDGNGQDSDVIAATYLIPKQPDGSQYDACVVVVRKIVHGRAITIPLLGDPADRSAVAFPIKAEILGLYDLSGDGRMQVVVQANYNDSEMTYIYDIMGVHAKCVLDTGCGV